MSDVIKFPWATPAVVEVKNEVVPVLEGDVVEAAYVDPNAEQIEADLKKVHKNVTEIVELGQKAVGEAAENASTSGLAEDYESLAALMRVQLNANDKLLGVHRSRRELVAPEEKVPEKVTNNNFFGSTAEVLAMLEAAKKNA